MIHFIKIIVKRSRLRGKPVSYSLYANNHAVSNAPLAWWKK